MRRSVPLIVLSLLAAPAGCDRASGDAPAPAAEAAHKKRARPPHLEGEVFDGGKRQRVLPFIAHSPDMDLAAQCRFQTEEARKRAEAGEPGVVVPPLCFDPEARAGFTVLRVEHRAGMTTPAGLAILREAGESAHFLVEATGSLHQILDLAHAPRRAGQLQSAEVRVLSGQEKGRDTLIATLQALYPKLSVEHHVAPPAPELHPVPPPAPPALLDPRRAAPGPPAAPPAPTRAAPDGP